MSHSTTHQRVSALCRALSAAAVAGTAWISPAHADFAGQDWKGYSGVNCMSQNVGEAVRRSAVNQSGLFNIGTSTVRVFCPVVRDVSEAGDNRVTAVAVRFRNRNSTVTGRCEFSSHDQNGIRIATRSAPAPFGETTLQLGPMDASAWGSYVLQCELPGRDSVTGLQSYIVNYRVDEAL